MEPLAKAQRTNKPMQNRKGLTAEVISGIRFQSIIMRKYSTPKKSIRPHPRSKFAAG
jgi:hypothetical protein